MNATSRRNVGDGNMNTEFLASRKSHGTRKNRFKNRSRLEIVSNLLTKAKSGALKTHLMYGANLSYPLVEEYLNILLESQLISKETDIDTPSVRYRTTSKGFEFLEHYGVIVSLLGDQNALVAGGSQSSPEELLASSLEYRSMEDSPQVAFQ